MSHRRSVYILSFEYPEEHEEELEEHLYNMTCEAEDMFALYCTKNDIEIDDLWWDITHDEYQDVEKGALMKEIGLA